MVLAVGVAAWAVCTDSTVSGVLIPNLLLESVYLSAFPVVIVAVLLKLNARYTKPDLFKVLVVHMNFSAIPNTAHTISATSMAAMIPSVMAWLRSIRSFSSCAHLHVRRPCQQSS